jgi:hypothetical protein
VALATAQLQIDLGERVEAAKAFRKPIEPQRRLRLVPTLLAYSQYLHGG